MPVFLKLRKANFYMCKIHSTTYRVSLLLLLFIPLMGLSQGRKELKKYKIKAKTEVVTDFVNGKEQVHNELLEKYDADGNTIESIEYNKDGTFKKKETRKYNKSGDVTEESRFDAAGTLLKKTVFTYNENSDKTSEQTVDGSGKVVDWMKSGYNSLGEKIFELQLDEKGKTLRKSMFTYDKNSLKKEKKVYDGNDVLISVKKYNYKTTSTED